MIASDALRGEEFREEDFPELQKMRSAGSTGECDRMNEVWKKPPISLEAYQKMVGHEVGVSSWHLVDQKPDRRLCRRDRGSSVHPCRSRARQARNVVRHHRGARFPDDVADEHHVLRGDAGRSRARRWASITASTSCASSRRCARARASAAALRLAEAKLRKPTELLSRTNVTVEIEGEEKPALVADWIGLIYFA